MTTATDIEEKIKEILYNKLGIERKEVTLQSNFINDLGMDSLDTVELVMEFEKEFNITIPGNDAEKISTIGQAVECIRKHKEERIIKVYYSESEYEHSKHVENIIVNSK